LRQIFEDVVLSVCLKLQLNLYVIAVLFWTQSGLAEKALAASDITDANSSISSSADGKTTIAVKVKGSTCVACLKHLQAALQAVAGVQSVEIDGIAVAAPSENALPTSNKSRHYAVYLIAFARAQISKSEIEDFIKHRDFRIVSVHTVESK
jgi:copper chaperone CopZ